MNADGLIRIPIRGKPKPRPRFDPVRRRTYMPDDYTSWRDQTVAFLRRAWPAQTDPIDGPLRLVAHFQSDGIDLQLYPVDGSRPTGVRADMDNLVGGLMDALQEAGVIANDNQILELEVRGWQ